MAEKIMPEGIRVFDKHANAPDFVVCSVVVTPADLQAFCEANAAILSDYQGKPQLRLQLLKSQAGKLYMAVDTYRRDAQSSSYQTGSHKDDPANIKSDLLWDQEENPF